MLVRSKKAQQEIADVRKGVGVMIKSSQKIELNADELQDIFRYIEIISKYSKPNIDLKILISLLSSTISHLYGMNFVFTENC